MSVLDQAPTHTHHAELVRRRVLLMGGTEPARCGPAKALLTDGGAAAPLWLPFAGRRWTGAEGRRPPGAGAGCSRHERVRSADPDTCRRPRPRRSLMPAACPGGVRVDPLAEDRFGGGGARRDRHADRPDACRPAAAGPTRRMLGRFFAAGGTMVFNGLLAYPFHPWAGPPPVTVRSDRPRLEDLRESRSAGRDNSLSSPLCRGRGGPTSDLSPGRGGILRPRREPAAAGGADPGDPGAGSGAGRLAVAPAVGRTADDLHDGKQPLAAGRLGPDTEPCGAGLCLPKPAGLGRGRVKRVA